MVLDYVISEMEMELREAGKDLWRVTLEWRRMEAKEWRETDAARGGVTWEAASGANSSGAEIGPSDGSAMSSSKVSQKLRKTVIWKEVAETQCYESCQQNDM